jgi:Spy/CpxP family protein refolding chaperone
MDKENKFNWKVRIATLSIFLLGFVAGALALNAYHVWFNPAASNTRQQRFERVLDQVQLSDQQKAEVQKIMSDAREEFKNLPPNPQVDDIRNRADEKLKKVFTPEQWDKFQQIRNDEKNKKQ